MKIATYKYENEVRTGVVDSEKKCIIPWSSLGYDFGDMVDVIKNLTDMIKADVAGKVSGVEGIPLDKVELLAPIPEPAQDVICLGINFFDHAQEVSKNSQKYADRNNPAIYFSKRVPEAVAPYGDINGHFDIVKDLDYEVELAVYIGRDTLDVSEEEAENYVFGYSVLNDVSARTLQTIHKQWYRGKSLDGFTPMGPWIVTKDEMAYPPALDLQCIVNGEVRQNNNTGNIVHGISQVVSELSHGMTLKAGTIIAMGTPSGVALGMPDAEQKYLKAGDVVECKIEGIGSIINTVR